ncbi:unannotated protein [freshwater metagenome]|uniref:Unannotated protein n=1 Tax=freshwater metagenome TaxID=449393 RepID=A0A6J6LLX7_9ZZZZ
MRAPSARQIWIAAVPTPDPPACTIAHLPDVSPPCTTSASHAVINTSGIAAASCSDIPAGTAIAWRSWRTSSSAYAPPLTMPITVSPTFHAVTRSPTAFTVPANSRPGISGP